MKSAVEGLIRGLAQTRLGLVVDINHYQILRNLLLAKERQIVTETSQTVADRQQPQSTEADDHNKTNRIMHPSCSTIPGWQKFRRTYFGHYVAQKFTFKRATKTRSRGNSA